MIRAGERGGPLGSKVGGRDSLTTTFFRRRVNYNILREREFTQEPWRKERTGYLRKGENQFSGESKKGKGGRQLF